MLKFIDRYVIWVVILMLSLECLYNHAELERQDGRISKIERLVIKDDD